MTMACRLWHIAAPLLVIFVVLASTRLVSVKTLHEKPPLYMSLLGQTRADVIAEKGEPAAVVTSKEELPGSPFNIYRHSTRQLEGPILVYFQEEEMIAIYLDEEDLVVCVYYGQKLDAPRTLTRREG